MSIRYASFIPEVAGRPPYEAGIDWDAKVGQNQLERAVVNLGAKRLIGGRAIAG